MARPLTRTNFHSSKLVRILDALTVVVSSDSEIDFAEKLGQWVDIADAIRLRVATNLGPFTTESPEQSNTCPGADEEYTRIRASLENSIAMRGSPTVDRAQIQIMSSTLNETMDVLSAYEPYRRFYLAHQRVMDLSVRSLRVKVRDMLVKTSPALKQLATIDAAFDEILSEREGKLFASIPMLLLKRFEQLNLEHRQLNVDTPQASSSDLRVKPGAWWDRFCNELRTVLLAELDVRLHPIQGLIEAFNHEKRISYE